MGKVTLQISVSLDGFAAGANIGHAHPLGENGEMLHHWMFDTATDTDRKISADIFADAGAFILGKRMFDLGIDLWGDDGAFGMPCFVLTHHPQPVLVKGPTTFSFVTNGIESALAQAKAAAGAKDVVIGGGANLAQQYLKAGLIDDLYIHIAPVLLGAGTRLFDNLDSYPHQLQIANVVTTPAATHIHYTT